MTHHRAVAILAAGLLALVPIASATAAPSRSESPPPSSTPSETSTPDPSDSSSPTDTTTSSDPATSTSELSQTTTTVSSDPTADPTAPPTQRSDPPPAPYSRVIDRARDGQEELAAEADRLSALVVGASTELDRLTLMGEAAADGYRLAESDLAAATARATVSRQRSDAADTALQAAQDNLGRFSRNSYISGSQFASDLLLLDSDGPAELIERAGWLEIIADSRTDALVQVTIANAASASADAAAEQARADKSAAEAAAKVALDASTTGLADVQGQLADLLVQKADYDAEFYAALVELLGPEGASKAIADYQAEQLTQDAAAAAARAAAYAGGPVLNGAWALPVIGRLTSCFCERWGTMHWGIDLAAPMYTPIYAAGDGVVLQAGAATGFGQAVYIQHSNGDVTVYGHMEVIEVTAGQTVRAGQEIAQVGTRGFSTGPHLHFEVQVGGIGGPRVDPQIWLANRGVFV